MLSKKDWIVIFNMIGSLITIFSFVLLFLIHNDINYKLSIFIYVIINLPIFIFNIYFGFVHSIPGKEYKILLLNTAFSTFSCCILVFIILLLKFVRG